MPIIRRLLTPATVYPEDLRYNEGTDTVQSNVNGTWEDNPAADPRTQTMFPPRITADPACDGAESVKDALHGQIDGVLEAIDNASTLFTIAGIILSIFTFGAYALFVSLALGIGNQMVGFGSAAIEAALTETVYHTLACILSCHMNAQGRLNAGELGLVQSEITAQIGGIGATILNAMLSLAGEGGVNNLASLGTSTGNCEDCGCVNYWCYLFDFTLSDGGWTGSYGTYNAGVGWEGTTAGTGVSIVLSQTLPSAHYTHMSMTILAAGTANAAIIVDNTTATVDAINVNGGTYQWNGAIDGTIITLNPSSGAGQGGQVTLTHVLFRGTGDNPFGADNCT